MKSFFAIFFIVLSYTAFSQERTKVQSWEHAIFLVNHEGNQLIKYNVTYTSAPTEQQISVSEQSMLNENDLVIDVVLSSNGMTVYAIQGYETSNDVTATLSENGIQATVSSPTIVAIDSQEVKSLVAKYH